jgi:hypothetical protein
MTKQTTPCVQCHSTNGWFELEPVQRCRRFGTGGNLIDEDYSSSGNEIPKKRCNSCAHTLHPDCLTADPQPQ